MPFQKKASLKVYGITYEQFVEMYYKQDKKCAICNKEIDINSRFTHIDHCHKTGKVRGLLCHQCNAGIGFLNDDINILANAIKYLTQ